MSGAILKDANPSRASLSVNLLLAIQFSFIVQISPYDLNHFKVLESWLQSGTIAAMECLSLDTCDSLSEAAITELVARHGHQLQALNLGGHSRLLEYFWISNIPRLSNIKVCVLTIMEFWR